jgi:integrase/recombinase XerD
MRFMVSPSALEGENDSHTRWTSPAGAGHHHKVEELLDAYLESGNLLGQKRLPLFRTLDRRRRLTENRMHRNEVLLMIKRRTKAANLPEAICCHTFRATGITVYLTNGGTIEKAQRIAGHESPRTTKLYDRTSDSLTLDEIERVVL